MSDINGTGMEAPPNSSPSGAVTSREATRKNPRQGLKVDTNRHGIRRETNLMPKPSKKKKYK